MGVKQLIGCSGDIVRHHREVFWIVIKHTILCHLDEFV